MQQLLWRGATLAMCVACVLPYTVQEASAQDGAVIVCPTDSCAVIPVYAPTVSGAKVVTLLSPASAGRPSSLRTAKLNTLPGLYRRPDSGQLVVFSRDGQIGENVVAGKVSRAALPQSDSNAWTIEYRDQPNSKTPIAIPANQAVAFMRGPHVEAVLVTFLKYLSTAQPPHPHLAQLFAAGINFAAQSEELRVWRDQLKNTMAQSLETYRSAAVEPALLEKSLADGMAAMAVYQAVAPSGSEQALQTDLAAEYRRLLERFAVVSALKHAGLLDAFLERYEQIGLARWSRPQLVTQAREAVDASAREHYQQGMQSLTANQFARAFDEGRVASSRAPCNEEINDFYNRARLEFVQKNMVPSLPEYDSENRTRLQQIVRELQTPARESDLTPEQTQYIRRRILEGEHLDGNYLPLQLKKAEFLSNIGELSASREVVTRIERTVPLGRSDGDEWLRMDARLTANLVTLGQTVQRTAKEHMSKGEFKEALEIAKKGLQAEPDNPRFLYFGAVAAAVLRDQPGAAELAQHYLRLLTPDCGASADTTSTIVDIYNRRSGTVADDRPDWIPNWMSGARYAPGVAFYDPVSGSFNARIIISTSTSKTSTTTTEFRWDGDLAASIQTLLGSNAGNRRTVLELEPVYDQAHVYMSGIGPRANSEGRRVMPLRYVNSPDFDAVLAAKFVGKSPMRGWAGNPFFHPFLWKDIFLFDLVYDDLGRIKEAIPVAPDASRPLSPFSERLTFVWEGSSKRLLEIKGTTYHRVMSYDKGGRLISEKISHPQGHGKIDYSYRGNSPELIKIECEDNFYDLASRTVVVQSAMVR